MEFAATFWVAVSFVIFILVLVYFKIPQKINELLSNMIIEIKNEINESEKLRADSSALLQKAQEKLSTTNEESNNKFQRFFENMMTFCEYFNITNTIDNNAT